MEEIIKKILIGSIILLVAGVVLFGITDAIVCLALVYISIVIFSIIIYFVPSIMAYDKQHSQKQTILLINFLLGWTVIGWIASLIWANIETNKTVNNDSGNKYEDLERLQKLKENGTITEAEFEAEKKKILE